MEGVFSWELSPSFFPKPHKHTPHNFQPQTQNLSANPPGPNHLRSPRTQLSIPLLKSGANKADHYTYRGLGKVLKVTQFSGTQTRVDPPKHTLRWYTLIPWPQSGAASPRQGDSQTLGAPSPAQPGAPGPAPRRPAGHPPTLWAEPAAAVPGRPRPGTEPFRTSSSWRLASFGVFSFSALLPLFIFPVLPRRAGLGRGAGRGRARPLLPSPGAAGWSRGSGGRRLRKCEGETGQGEAPAQRGGDGDNRDPLGRPGEGGRARGKAGRKKGWGEDARPGSESAELGMWPRGAGGRPLARA